MRRRRNADDRLRKLERAAQSKDFEDVAAYWRACLQAGVLPKPTEQHGFQRIWAIEKAGYSYGPLSLFADTSAAEDRLEAPPARYSLYSNPRSNVIEIYKNGVIAISQPWLGDVEERIRFFLGSFLEDMGA